MSEREYRLVLHNDGMYSIQHRPAKMTKWKTISELGYFYDEQTADRVFHDYYWNSYRHNISKVVKRY